MAAAVLGRPAGGTGSCRPGELGGAAGREDALEVSAFDLAGEAEAAAALRQRAGLPARRGAAGIASRSAAIA